MVCDFIKRFFQHSLPIHRKLCFCFFQRFHPGIELGKQFLNPGNDALLLCRIRDKVLLVDILIIQV